MLAYSFVLALLLGYLVKVTIGFRVDGDDEVTGIDETEHAETAYDFSTLRGGTASARPAGQATTAPPVEAS